MMRTKHFLAFVAAAAMATTAQAQTCAGATPISGFGQFNYNSAGQASDNDASCSANSPTSWFAWTATVTGNTTINTCTNQTYDTALAVFASCGGAQLACNDDGGPCGSAPDYGSQVTFNATAGTTYRIRCGGWNGDSGTGTIDIFAALPGDCDNPATGPDVIVGALTGPSNYSGQGGVGAYAIGTTSCNIGTAELLWIAGNNQHPVIGQNIYRHEGNTFEQIGMSWLKHGFTALQQDLCCDCSSSGTGTRLGVGCSDPYSSGLNGQQGGLGPRYQVNAYTGFFNYPYAGQGATGNSIFKRIQIANSDLDPGQHPSATIIGEGQYIAPDDAAAGNGFNNVSYRLMDVGSFSNGRWTLSFNGATVRQEPAIRAWPTLDPNAQLTDVTFPAAGMFIVGNTATDNGNGTWHYEYAVYNMNNHDCCREVEIPVPAGITVTNIGFKDIDYHSGETQASTNWTSARNSDNVTWSTETFAQNQDANAIRWGTLYNFRFDADAPPTTVDGRLGLFRSGGNKLFSTRAPECPGVVATQTSRVGSPANPAALQGGTQRPVIGTVWNPSISHASFYTDAPLDVLLVNAGNTTPINVPTGFGTLLCNIPAANFIFFSPAGVPFGIGIPDDCALVGATVCSQGGSLGGSQGIVATNALDLVIGNL